MSGLPQQVFQGLGFYGFDMAVGKDDDITFRGVDG